MILVNQPTAVVARSRLLLTLLITAAFVLVAGIQLLTTRIEPVLDQTFIKHSLLVQGYPRFEQGISSYLLAGLYNLLGSGDPLIANAHIRTIAMAFYLLSGAVLLWSVTKDQPILVWALLMSLLFTSRYIFLWLSSELFAAAFLMLILWTLVKELPWGVTAVVMALFALAKPDLILSGAVVGLGGALMSSGQRTTTLARLALFGGSVGLLLLPGFLQYGLTYLRSDGRAFMSFSEHYAALIQRHQILAQTPNPWFETEQYMEPIWGSVTSVAAAIRSDPNRYMDFVFLSISQSLRNLFWSNLLLLAPLAAYCWWVAPQRTIKRMALLFFVGLIPIVLLSYLHIRYTARFYPLVLFVIGLGLPYIKPNHRRPLLAYLGLLVLLQLFQLSKVFPTAYWVLD